MITDVLELDDVGVQMARGEAGPGFTVRVQISADEIEVIEIQTYRRIAGGWAHFWEDLTDEALLTALAPAIDAGIRFQCEDRHDCSGEWLMRTYMARRRFARAPASYMEAAQ